MANLNGGDKPEVTRTKETSGNTISYGTVVDRIANGVTDLVEGACSGKCQKTGAFDRLNELLRFAMNTNRKVYKLAANEVGLAEAQLPAKLVDWLNISWGVFVYDEYNGDNLKASDKSNYTLPKDWDEYHSAISAIAKALDRRNQSITCDKRLISNEYQVFTTDMQYLDLNTGKVLMGQNVGKLLPILDVNGSLVYKGEASLELGTYIAKLGDSLKNVLGTIND